MTGTEPSTAGEPADRLAAVVRAIPGVADLHSGMFGEVGTYLPGRRVPGIRLTDDTVQIHLSALVGSPIRDVAAAVRRAVTAEYPGLAVDVTVEDVIEPA